MAKKIFSYPDEFYDMDMLLDGFMSRSQMAKEYNRLRKIANERLQKFDGTEWTKTQVYKSNKGKYDQNIREMNKVELAESLSQVSKFLRKKTSTVEGLKKQRNRSLKSLRENSEGRINIRKADFIEFGEFMDDYREQEIDKLYDSERVALLYQETRERKISADEVMENFDYYYDNLDYLRQTKIKKQLPKDDTSSDYYRARISAIKAKKRKE